MTPIKILIADDQRLFAESLKRAIEVSADDIKVIKIVDNGRDALEAVKRHSCDIVLMDVRMPVLNGVDATKLILQARPETKIIVLTTFDDDDYIFEAITHGAKGYALKNVSPSTILSFIRTVHAGGTVMSPEVAAKLAQHKLGRRHPEWYESFQPREKEVLRYLCAGKDNAEIAEIVHIGRQTVKNYISSIYAKMGVRNRIEALKLAYESGIYQEPVG